MRKYNKIEIMRVRRVSCRKDDGSNGNRRTLKVLKR